MQGLPAKGLNLGIREQMAAHARPRPQQVVGVMSPARAPKRARLTMSTFLRTLFVAGRITSKELATAAYVSITPSTIDDMTTLTQWAKAGNESMILGNIHRDLQRNMQTRSTLPDVYEASIPLWNRVKNKQYMERMYFTLPYEELYQSLQISPEDFNANYCDADGPMANILAEWCRRMKVTFTEPLVGFGAWGDSAPLNKRDSLYCVLYNSTTGLKSKNRSRFAAWSKRSTCNCGCKGKCTFEEIWKIMKWNADVMLVGELPTTRHDGIKCSYSSRIGDVKRATMARRKLGFRGVFIQFRGDWQFYKQALNLTGWRAEGKNHRVCWKCHASTSTGPLCYRHVSTNAGWRDTKVSHEAFLNNILHNNTFCSVLFSFPGFRLDYVLADLMHVGELGILQYLLGNTFYDLFLQIGGKSLTLVRLSRTCCIWYGSPLNLLAWITLLLRRFI